MNKLAIVVPYYKIDFFEKTLDSIANQTDKRFKLYIGNDASPNDPQCLINQYLSEVNYEYYDYKDNVGGKSLVNQWERILQNVEEEWFQILGDDDTISPNFVESFYKNLNEVENNKITAIRYSYYKIDEDDNVLSSFDYDWKIKSSQDFMLAKLNWEAGSSLSENIFKTKIWRKNRFRNFPLAWHSDDYAVIEFSGFGNLFNIRDAYVNVRLSNQSITGNDTLSEEKLSASYQFYKELILNRKKLTNRDLYILALNNYLFICRKLKLKPSKVVIKESLSTLNIKLNLSLLKTLALVSNNN